MRRKEGTAGKTPFYRKALRNKAAAIFAVLALSALDAWIAVRIPALMAETVDGGVAAMDLGRVRESLGRMLLFSVSGSLTSLLILLFSTVISQQYADDLRCDLFDRLLSQSYEKLTAKPAGTLLTRVVGDCQMIAQFLVTLLQTLIRPLFFIVFTVYSIRRVAPRYLYVILVAVPVEMFLLWFFIRKLNPHFRKIQYALEKMNTYLQRMISSLRFIRVNRLGEAEEKRFGGLNGDFYETSMSIQQWIVLMNPLMLLVLNLAIVATLLLSALWAGRSVGIGTGNVLAVIMYLQQLLMCMLMTGQISQEWSRFRISRDRVMEVWGEDGGEPSAERKASGSGGPGLCCEKVSYVYPGTGTAAVQDVSLRVSPGETVALIGPTGSGKSTLCEVLAGLRSPTSGTVLLDGALPREGRKADGGKRILLVPQKQAMISGTVRENIAFGLENAGKEEIQAAARAAGADDFIQKMPQGYDTPVTQEGNSLSGGQRQSLSIARALLRKPDMLILDDCVSAMDTAMELRFRKGLRAAYPGMTVIYVTNRMRAAREADSIVVMDGGRISARGTHAELFSQPGFYRDASMLQQGEEPALADSGDNTDADNNHA